MTYNMRFIEEQTIKKNFLCISVLSDEDREQSRKKNSKQTDLRGGKGRNVHKSYKGKKRQN